MPFGLTGRAIRARAEAPRPRPDGFPQRDRQERGSAPYGARFVRSPDAGLRAGPGSSGAQEGKDPEHQVCVFGLTGPVVQEALRGLVTVERNGRARSFAGREKKRRPPSVR